MKSRFFGDLPLTSLSGIGSILEKKFADLGIKTVSDLLFHFPIRYENRAAIHAIADLTIGEQTTIAGQIIKSDIVTTKRRPMLICHIQDDSGIAVLKFLNFNQGMRSTFSVGKEVTAYGEVKAGQRHFEMLHPQIQLKSLQAKSEAEDPQFTPIYGTTFGLTQHTIRKTVDAALLLLKHNPPVEILPPALTNQFWDVTTALFTIHHPPITLNIDELTEGKHPAIKRFIYEELLAYHLSMLTIKMDNQKQFATPLRANEQLIRPFLANLPFTPTAAQQRVVEDIFQDMAKSVPMMRLIQGDVGSGKTVVAALAALNAIENGKQVALMAPTEILAEQHFINFTNWLTPLGIDVDLLSGRLTAKNRAHCLEKLVEGKTSLLIGTHALFVDKVAFADLGLVIIDEQHRFGVNQRLSLWEKGEKDHLYPHQLIMTATPIPRTLAMTVYADLDLSIIDELPPGRTPITTVVLPNSRRDEIIDRVKQACQTGRQVYWVCTLVQESEAIDAKAAELLVEELRILLPSITIDLVHGKMRSEQKQSVMQRFKQGEISLLVATTVIEVGVDVPNASLMIIENAERLGLAQLHQLRGRVGRGTAVSHCVLMYQPPLSKVAMARMKVMRESSDGFVIAQKDLEIRGGGEILGTRQIGGANFKIVDLIRDQALISEVQKASYLLLQHHPQNAKSLIERWLPDREKYINA
ncbi:ATP-dependent DNA helicase RecG [Orbaceae bacterium ESL0721]|nr:ATP-dependent DNA helicase RecG [Orbaceae bacterium ESL0721]